MPFSCAPSPPLLLLSLLAAASLVVTPCTGSYHYFSEEEADRLSPAWPRGEEEYFVDDGGESLEEQGRVHQVLRRAPETSAVEAIGCVGSPPAAAVFGVLNAVCEDCFRLFREQEIYHMCRSDCFGSEFFLGCMDYLIYERSRVRSLAGLVRGVHQYFKKR